MTRAVIYLRTSLDPTGDRLAVQRHEEACRALVAARGWSLVEVYEDNSISASDSRRVRPAYAAMEDAYRTGRFDALVCWDLDRLSRQPRQLEDWIDAATERGLLLVTANGDADLSTDGGRMYARIKLAVARAEVERKSARQRSAAGQRARLGKPPLGVRLTGYTTKGDVVPDEAAMVVRMFTEFASGNSLRGIVEGLERDGLATRRGRPWHPSAVRTILLNPRYAGRAIYDGEVLPGVEVRWPALIDAPTFDLVQERLTDPRRRTQQGTDRRHLGAGLYVCGECDRPVHSHGPRYRCPAGHVTRTGAPVDALVLAVVRGRLAKPDVVQYLTPTDDTEAERLAGEAAALRARLVRFEQDYDEGLIDGHRYAEAAGKTRASLQAVEAARAAAVGSPALAGVAGAPDPVLAFDSAPLMVQREVVDAFVTVRLLPQAQGRRGFDPASVEVRWRAV